MHAYWCCVSCVHVCWCCVSCVHVCWCCGSLVLVFFSLSHRQPLPGIRWHSFHLRREKKCPTVIAGSRVMLLHQDWNASLSNVSQTFHLKKMLLPMICSQLLVLLYLWRALKRDRRTCNCVTRSDFLKTVSKKLRMKRTIVSVRWREPRKTQRS